MIIRTEKVGYMYIRKTRLFKIFNEKNILDEPHSTTYIYMLDSVVQLLRGLGRVALNGTC